MCCRCCSVTQQKFWVFSTGTIFLIVGIITTIWWSTWINNIILKSFPLTPTSKTFDKWEITPIPVYVYMYLFNWTNAEDARTPGVKPNFEQVGPYVYAEYKRKEDIKWNDNTTVSFRMNRTWFYEPSLSPGLITDLVTAPHLPSIAALSTMRNESTLVKYAFNRIINSHGGALYQTHTAGEWLFEGFFDEFLDYAIKTNNSQVPVESNYFAWYLGRNGSSGFEGLFNIDTGVNDISQLGELKSWNGMNHTGWFDGECGRINGSTADLWVPGREHTEPITLFMRDCCRIINLIPTGEWYTIEGVRGIKYETKPETFDNGQLNADMSCYCPASLQPDNCPPTGATDLRGCGDNVPMFLSHAHFMYADPYYANTTTGMNPNYERDNFYIIMEPKYAVPLFVKANIQVSLFIQQDNDFTILKDIPDFYAPLFIIDSKGTITPELAKEIRLVLNLPSIGHFVGIALIVIGIILIIVGIILTKTRNWYGQKNSETIKKDTTVTQK